MVSALENSMFRTLLPLALLFLSSSAYASEPRPNAPAVEVGDGTTAKRNLTQIVADHVGLDINDDQHPEIQQLEVLPDLSPGIDQPGVIVFVEQRLLENDQQLLPVGQLQEQLEQYAQALQEDDLNPVFVAARLEKSESHQDGLTLIAMRRFLQQVKKSFPGFQGAVLLGSFPEAMLVRRWAWLHSSRAVTFDGVTYNRGKGPRATYLAFDPELVSHRTDIVLTDLDGNWESCYVQQETELDSIKLIADDPATYERMRDQSTRITAHRYSIHSKTFEDFFLIDDAQYKIIHRSPKQLELETSYQLRLPEVAAEQRSDPNPLATPDIMVSRINALHVAANPDPALLADDGLPKTLEADLEEPNRFQRSPELERQLLVDYLKRNLHHRQSPLTDQQNRAALLTTDLRTFGGDYLKALSENFSPTIEFSRANAVAFARFMATPAIVKGISAHSNANSSVLISDYPPADLDAITGGRYWRWQRSDQQLIPSYQDRSVCNTASTALLRTMWENGKLSDSGSCFYIHAGCEATSANRAERSPYHAADYGGHTQIAESLLFYGNGLALIGRAKVFYDKPSHPERYFNQSEGRFGDILSGYFAEEQQSEKMGRDVAGRNRAYFWSILGDWTLRLQYPNP